MESAAKSTDKALGLYGMIHYGIIYSDFVQNYTLLKRSDTFGKVKKAEKRQKLFFNIIGFLLFIL